MSELRTYDVTINGTTTQMQLNEEDAKAYGDAAKPAGSGFARQQRSGTEAPAVKTHAPLNKARDTE